MCSTQECDRGLCPLTFEFRGRRRRSAGMKGWAFSVSRAALQLLEVGHQQFAVAFVSNFGS